MILLDTIYFCKLKYETLPPLILVSITPLDPVEMNHFQIFGPRSHAILDAVLKLCKDDNGDGHDHHREQHESWSRLVKNSVYPSSTPPGTVYDLYVQDPRVK